MTLRNAQIGLLALLALAGTAGTALADVGPLFGGVLKPLKGDDQFVNPVTSPYYNENSFITTDLRGWFVYHKFNSDALGSGSSATDYAVQIRVALTESLQLVAYKDGFLDLDGTVNTQGWNDLAAGIKWQFLRNDDAHLYAAVGAGYEFCTGESDALQNDAEARIWASVDKGFGKFHTGATLNYRIHTSNADRDNGNCDVLSWHLRGDYRLNDIFSPVVEFNGYHIINDSSTGLALNGADVLNLGAKNADATITGGIGCEFRCGESTALRVAYEVPLSNNNSDLYGTRLTFSIIYTF